MRIEIVGGIASGKTTFAHAIRLTGIRAIYEDFSRNPFFLDFYRDPVRFSFQTEIAFLLQHYSAIDVALQSNTELCVADYSVILDLAYARVTLDSADLRVFEVVLDRVLEKIHMPELLVKLECTPMIELERIRARARPAEAAIQLSYLATLDEAANDVLGDHRFKGLNVLRIDSEKQDFRLDGKDRNDVVAGVLKQFPYSAGIEGSAGNGAKSLSG
jgi:deoxyadenosine/deoxycytidine kinase